MAWSLGPIPDIESDAQSDEKLQEQFDRMQEIIDSDSDEHAKGEAAAIKAAKAAAKSIIKSGAAGGPPYEISVASHPAVAQSGSRPYVSVSVVGVSEGDAGGGDAESDTG